jgi:hypothetical protein
VCGFVRSQLENSLGGQTPLSVVGGVTIPQLVALYFDAPGRARDPFAPGPGERRLSAAVARRLLAEKKHGKAAQPAAGNPVP